MATWTGNGPNSRTFVSNIKTGERSWQVDLETHNHSEIREMQQKLSSFGFSTQGADGTYGNNTKNAVINFQRAFPTCGTPDGYFGKNTLNTFVSKVGSLAGYTGPGSGGSSDSWSIRWTNTPGETVNVRSGPSKSNSIVRKLSHGTKVEVNTPNSTWSEVRLYNTSTVLGYIMTEFLVASDPNGSIGNRIYTGTINAVDTAVRSSMSTGSNGNLVGRYANGAPIGYRETSNSEWHQVYFGYKPNTVGYTKSNLITQTNLTISELLASIAQFWYDKNYTQGKFGMGSTGEEWCQWFVNFCVTQAGLSPLNNWVTNTNCTGGWNALKNSKFTEPEKGAIFYTKRGTDTVSHTGIVVDVVSSTKCYVVDGNYNGSSNLTRRLFDTQNMASGTTFLGFVKPNGM